MLKAFVILIVIGCAFGKDWWENGNFYQIYPRSFKDSDGDGIGDLNGVAQELQYLKDIGITAVWLSPIFKSPMADFGYDISDYYQIHPEYGTLEDFVNLLKKAKEVGVKIILDFVPNHTSDEHEWFQKSVKNESIYADFYVWDDGIPNPNDTNKRLPPSNWLSQFRYSAWKWNDERQQFYLHQFADKQPDLNYRNPEVVKAMKDILRYWLAMGVNGFRIDAVPYLFEKEKDKNDRYLNEPAVLGNDCPDPDDYCHLQHLYTMDQPETYDMIYQWRELVDEYKKEHGGGTRVLLTEAYTSLEYIIKFYGDGTRNGSNVPFNFELLTHLKNSTTAVEVSSLIDSWLEKMPKGVYPNWVLGNHDNKRLASRLGENRIDLFNIMLQTLPGIAITYNGEEIGMTDVYISWEETVDPQACNANPNNFNSYSRDPARTPFQWDASNKAGFTTGSETWLPVSPTYKTNNVLLQQRAPVSHLQVFKKLLKLRKEPSFQDGSFEKKVIGTDILIYKRELSGSDIYIIVLNLGKNSQKINLKDYFNNVGDTVEVITTSIHAKYNDGDVLSSNNFTAEPEVGTVLVSVK